MKGSFRFIILFILFSIVVITEACKAPNKSTNEDSSPTSASWNGKSAAVVLTYDDGLHVHLDNVVPVLNANNIIGTFYVHTDSDSFKSRKSEWKDVADQGHELGNHTVFHPCAGQSKDRDWVSKENDLDNYSVDQILEEIATANADLHAIDGKTKRTYAYTCGDTSVLDSSYVSGIKDKFVSARGVNRAQNRLQSLDRFSLNAHGMNGHTAKQMIALVDQAINENSLLVFLFHGVGGEHDLNVQKEAHDELINYIKQRQNDIWISSLVDVMTYTH